MKGIYCIALLFIIAGCRDENTYLEDGMIKNELGYYKSAIRDFDECIRLSPNSTEAYIGRGQAYYFLGDTEKAIINFQQASLIPVQGDENPVDRIFYWYGLCFLDNDVDSALYYLNMVPDNSDLISYSLYHCGFIFIDKGDYEKAKASFDQAIEKNIFSSNAYCGRGIANYFLSADSLSIKDLDLAIIYDNKNTLAYYYRGLCYARLKKRDLASKDFLKAAHYGHSQAEKLAREYSRK